MKCFYHSADLDGHCSGALVKIEFPECELRGINYGQEFPWDDIVPGETVYMVDFCLEDIGDMISLSENVYLVWIDHHITALKKAEGAGFNPPGLRRDGTGACQLTQEYLLGLEGLYEGEGDIFTEVRLLALYDVWDHSDPRVLPFQYRVRLEETRPDIEDGLDFWKKLVDLGRFSIADMVHEGELILRYQDQQNSAFCRAYSFETDLVYDAGDCGRTWKAICANRGLTNSQLFDSVWDPEKFELMITFCRLPLPKKLWTVSLYSCREDIHCGEIAQQFGGGGHKGAAGFQCMSLPFSA